MEDREYSKRLGVLSGEQLQAAVSRFDVGELVAAEAPVGGLFGQNVFLTTTAGEFVLRGAPHLMRGLRAGFTPARAPADPNLWQFSTEQYFARAIHEQTSVGAPWPYLIEPSHDIFGWPFAVMPRLPGANLADRAVRAALTPDDLVEIARAMGATLASMQTAGWPVTGEYDPASNSLAAFEHGFAAWVEAYIDMLIKRCRLASDRTTDADVEWCKSIVIEGAEALRMPFQPTFVHEDYQEGNLAVKRGSNGWEVSGVFDLMTAYVGDGEVDLSRSIAAYTDQREPGLRQAFLEGYRERRPLRPGFGERFPVYMLLDRLHIWEYGQRNSLWFEGVPNLRSYAERLTSLKIRE